MHSLGVAVSQNQNLISSFSLRKEQGSAASTRSQDGKIQNAEAMQGKTDNTGTTISPAAVKEAKDISNSTVIIPAYRIPIAFKMFRKNSIPPESYL